MKYSLRNVKDHQAGRIAAVRAAGELGRRIRDMGILPGAAFRLQGRAPLKDPVVLKLTGCTVTLRNNEADYIEVEIED
jgi:ferrous iron transport protein A